mgnify:CR=1 FL=1
MGNSIKFRVKCLQTLMGRRMTLCLGYDLRLMSVINTDDLVNEGRSLIIVALVGEKVQGGFPKFDMAEFPFFLCLRICKYKPNKDEQ